MLREKPDFLERTEREGSGKEKDEVGRTSNIWDVAALQRSTASSDLNGMISHPDLRCNVASRRQSQHPGQPFWDTPQRSCRRPTLSCQAQGSLTDVSTNSLDSRSLHSQAPSSACVMEGALGGHAQQSASPSASLGRCPGCDCAVEGLRQPRREPSPGQASGKGSSRARAGATSAAPKHPP